MSALSLLKDCLQASHQTKTLMCSPLLTICTEWPPPPKSSLRSVSWDNEQNVIYLVKRDRNSGGHNSIKKAIHIIAILKKVHYPGRRTVYQDDGRIIILCDLKENDVLVILDWTMKYLPQVYHEKMKDFFDQKCMCCSIQGSK